MDKNFLVNQLHHHQNTFGLGLAALELLSLQPARDLLRGRKLSFGTFEIDLTQLAVAPLNTPDDYVARAEFLKVQMRAIIKEPFEHIKAYCNESDQFPRMQSATWYEFARHIRNCLSHDFHFAFLPKDLSKLPVTWRGKQITASMQATELDFAFFGEGDAWQLFLDMQAFAGKDLA